MSIHAVLCLLLPSNRFVRFMGFIFCLSFSSSQLFAAIAQTPLATVQAAPPQVLLVMSNDHQLYYKAYVDWTDLDGDGIPNTTYTHSFTYYGYFDPFKCYTYSTTNGQFEPAAIATTKYCATPNNTQWSGNFLNWATMTRIDILRKVFYGGYRSTDTATGTGDTVLERSYLPSDAHSFAKYYNGTDINQLTPFSPSTNKITLCNTTYTNDTSGANSLSHSTTVPPRISVAQVDARYWAANERWQCTWDNERGSNASGSNSTGSKTADPSWNNDRLGDGNYTARVKVCVSGLIGTESCKQYGTSLKPTGLLHDYGEDDILKFGLITGSYQKNKSGGVLRRNIGSFSTEINADDGTFNTAVNGIVSTLNKLRIGGYSYNDGQYSYSGGSYTSCPYGLNDNQVTEGRCSGWGNPLNEIYLEAVRYFGGLSATSAFNANDTGYISGLSKESWVSPITGDTWCAPCHIILINASEISYESDNQMITTGLPGPPDAADLTSALGVLEGISGGNYFVGENSSNHNQLCTSKQVNSLGEVRGTCPGSPRLSGSYLGTGIAHWAHTHDVNATITGTQTIATRSIALVSAAPNIRIPVPGTNQVVKILPAMLNTARNPDTGGGLVDFKIINQDLAAGTGEFYINWEINEQGGDYDQDMSGTLRYVIADNTIQIFTKLNQDSSSQTSGFGYILNGTLQDGFHAHSGIDGFDYEDPTAPLPSPSVGGCNNCSFSTTETRNTYTIGSSSASLLKDPLEYIAKYGSFRDMNGNNNPDTNDPYVGNQEWDTDGDGVVDGYFQVNDPAALGPALASVFETVAGVSSSASVAANSASLQTGTRIYQARFDSGDWSGDLLAIPLNINGSLGTVAWQAKLQVQNQAWDTGRVILSYTKDKALKTDGVVTGYYTGGIRFKWGGMTGSQRNALRTPLSGGTADEDTQLGKDRLDYIRGSNANEQSQGGTFRNRDYVLGDIVNSTPIFVGAPASNYPDSLAADSYATFAEDNKDRTQILYVGANDGMLHGFSVDTGDELIAYVPQAVYSNLSALTATDYGLANGTSHQYYVDGNPALGDAYLSLSDGNHWRTVLVSGLRGGGQGLFALDVTDPTQFIENNTKAEQLVLWDITSADTGFEDLGYTYSTPVIVKLQTADNSGKWVAMFGNGYESASGKAVFYIVDLANGALLHTVTLDAGPNNGLSSVAPIDIDGDHKVDYVYAGDLKGHLWRLEFDGSSTSWVSSFLENDDPQPLFTATDSNGNPQPITTRPEVGLHPNDGVMIYFGTGKYYETGDNAPDGTHINDFYAVWDRSSIPGSSVNIYGILPGHLLPQTVEHVVTHVALIDSNGDGTNDSSNTYKMRVTSDNPISWYTGTTLPEISDALDSPKLGWHLTLPETGEMQVTDSILHAGRIIFVTQTPSEQLCDFGGTSWLMELDAIDGGRTATPVFDLNSDGAFDNSDKVAVTLDDETKLFVPTGKQVTLGDGTGGGIAQKPTIISAGDTEYKYGSTSNQAQIDVTVESPGSTDSGGRKSWVQLQ